MKTFHIIIRPREENFKVGWYNILKDNFSDFLRYTITIALERGKSDIVNHIDMSVSCNSRQDNVRSKVIRCLEFVPSDDDEAKSWLRVVTHDNPEYCHGYTLKEQCGAIDTGEISDSNNSEWFTNHKNIIGCIQTYNEGVKKFDRKTNSLNELLQVAQLYYDNNSILFVDGCPTLRSICVILVEKGLIPFSLGRKVRRGDELFFKHWVENLSVNEIEYEIARLDE